MRPYWSRALSVIVQSLLINIRGLTKTQSTPCRVKKKSFFYYFQNDHKY